MNFKNMYILCQNLEQRDQVYDVLKEWGYRHIGIWDDGDRDLIVATYVDGDFSAVAEWKHTHTFDEFMACYDNALVKKIRMAKLALGLSNRKLSVKLGYSQNYVTRNLNKLPSLKVQHRLISEINMLLAPVWEAPDLPFKPYVDRRRKLEKIAAGVLIVIILVLIFCVVGVIA